MIADLTPSFATGIATNASESAYPEQWEGLKQCYAPALGNQGKKLFNIKRLHHGDRHAVRNTLADGDWKVSSLGGSALNFAAIGDRVLMQQSTVGTELTYTAWCRLNTNGASQAVMAVQGTLITMDSSGFAWYPDTNLHVAIHGIVWTVGRWYHLAVVHRGSAYRMFIDGKLVKSGTNGALWEFNQAHHIGAFTTTLWPFKGQIAEVRHYGVAKSDRQVQQMYASRFGMYRRREVRRFYAAEPPAPTFNSAWARGSNVLISPGVF